MAASDYYEDDYYDDNEEAAGESGRHRVRSCDTDPKNENIEIRNKSESSKLQCSKGDPRNLPLLLTRGASGNSEHLDFSFRICFGFRASGF